MVSWTAEISLNVVRSNRVGFSSASGDCLTGLFVSAESRSTGEASAVEAASLGSLEDLPLLPDGGREETGPSGSAFERLFPLASVSGETELLPGAGSERPIFGDELSG
jgi:hypothetical protein